MSSDVLAETLEALRLRGTAYFKADFRAPWGMAVPAKDVAAFHVVVQGQCWLRVPGETPRELGQGDVVLFPEGTAHELVHAADADASPAEDLLGRPGEAPKLGYGGTGSITTLVCGHFSYDRRGLHPFFAALPKLVHISGEDEPHASWVATASQMAAAESTAGQRGASVVVDRLAEALLIQTLRQFLARSAKPEGFLAAVQDPPVGRALACIHGRPERKWNVGDLAHEAGIFSVPPRWPRESATTPSSRSRRLSSASLGMAQEPPAEPSPERRPSGNGVDRFQNLAVEPRWANLIRRVLPRAEMRVIGFIYRAGPDQAHPGSHPQAQEGLSPSPTTPARRRQLRLRAVSAGAAPPGEGGVVGSLPP